MTQQPSGENVAELKPCPYHGDINAMEFSGASKMFAACTKCDRENSRWYRPVEDWNNAHCWKLLSEKETALSELATKLAEAKAGNVALKKDMELLREYIPQADRLPKDLSIRKIREIFDDNAVSEEKLTILESKVLELSNKLSVAREALNKLKLGHITTLFPGDIQSIEILGRIEIKSIATNALAEIDKETEVRT